MSAANPSAGTIVRHALTSLPSDRRGSSAVEFAIIGLPLIMSLLLILQMGLYYMTQAALDTGVIQAADTLVNAFNGTSTPTIPDLKTLVTAKGGGLLRNNATSLRVELLPFAMLSAAALPVTDTVNAGTAKSLLALRAQASVPSFFPGFSSLLNVKSSALLRRQDN